MSTTVDVVGTKDCKYKFKSTSTIHSTQETTEASEHTNQPNSEYVAYLILG